MNVEQKPTGNETVPKIIINNTVNLLFKTAVSIFLISNHNSLRVLFDKIASVYFIRENILYFSIGYGHWPAQGTSTVPVVSAHFPSLLYGGISIPLRRVTLLRRRAQANAPAASY